MSDVDWELNRKYLVKWKNTSWSSLHEITILKFSKNKKAVLVHNSFQPSLGHLRQDIHNWYDLEDLKSKIEIFDDLPDEG